LISYTDKSGYSTGLKPKSMPAGGKQIAPNPAAIKKS
jgi:hypothetical protein